MPKITKGKGPTNVGKVRAHSVPIGIAAKPAQAATAGQVAKPARSASKADWVAYAGLVLDDDVADWRKGAIIAAVEGALMSGWDTLLAIRKEAVAEFTADRQARPTACPIDGTPLEARGGKLHCPFDGWTYPDDPNPLHGEGA